MTSIFNLTTIGRGLPVAGVIDQLPDLLRSGNVVVEAPPGTGKTTLVPPAVANEVPGKVIVTAPRRVAVRAAARRLSHLSGEPAAVGYAVRGDTRPGSKVEFVTPGVLLRRLLNDPELAGVSAVIIDEVHERQVDTDLVLAMCAEIAQLRDDFRLLAMSATVDAAFFAELIDASVLSTPAVTHPVDVTYSPHPGRAECSREFLDHLANLAAQARQRYDESVLVFVPGAREVEHVAAACAGLPLHGQLSNTEQDAALAPSQHPRIVVSTSLAESSLTVPGVRTVVDSGLSRVPRRDSARGMSGLVTLSAARSTVDQRAGRAGREGPGRVIRAYSEADYRRLQPHITPEIATADLTDACLQLAAWGTPRGEGLPLPSAPAPSAIADAETTLMRIGAVDADGHITEHGRRIASLPLPPQLGHALEKLGSGAAGAIAVLADSPRGDLTRLRPDNQQKKRLERLAAASTSVDIARVTATAYPGQIAKLSGEDYLLASGTRARLPGDMGLNGASWLAIAEASRTGQHATIRAAARLTQEDAEEILGVTEQVQATLDAGKIRGRRIRRLGAIELSSTPVQVDPAHAAEALRGQVTLEDFTLGEKARQLFERLRFLHTTVGSPWPDPATIDLSVELDALARGKALSAIDVYPALQRALPWPEAAHLDALAPTHLDLPSGRRARISYETGRPVVSTKLQDCFGLTASPVIGDRPVQFHLLSPAGRPLAVTDDLASFFAGPYQGVRKDMRGRYPKHSWPEDPLALEN
ncbi:ATP-dependent RNA helicase [Corynebacterium tapiri]|uniref:ATP-dependent RNA helicase n=1 Tax=Corynebacterium tapiri TaxID=1448266 RepID=A0A5C4U4I9_9CORY|nr:ATP-dependent helicase C-terminal domain-containing protein [Corynebacterium tapiri]TNL96786.1 ATP-dependent RNA helicase [Corynebacterium tapiri]